MNARVNITAEHMMETDENTTPHPWRNIVGAKVTKAISTGAMKR